MLFKCSHLFKASDVVWGLICARHHLSASFGQDVAVNGSLCCSLPTLPNLPLDAVWRSSTPAAWIHPALKKWITFFFLGPSKSSFLCAFSLHKDLHICVCQRGVLTSSAGRALFVYFLFLFFSSRNHFLPKKRDFLWPWLWHLSGLQRYRGKDKGISVLS